MTIAGTDLADTPAAAGLRAAKRVVIKVGSALLVDETTGRLRDAWLRSLAGDIARMRARGQEVIVVSSGAIALGRRLLGLGQGVLRLEEKQAAAATGQIRLAHAYETVLGPHGIQVAQVLLTLEDSEARRRYLNARATLGTLLKLGAVPVINENDTVVYDEIKFGDNDTLGALVANLTEADCLVILTDQQGLYTADPRKDPDATLISDGDADDPRFESMAGGAGTGISRGGMITKVRAARRAARSGADTIIASGREPDVLLRLVRGEAIGSFLRAGNSPLAARKQWMADHLQLAGAVVLDDGAVKALHEGRSLLPIGVTEVQGQFERGAVVACRDRSGQELARGLINYSASETRRIARRPSADIEGLLGYVDEPELIHRDNMVVVARS